MEGRVPTRPDRKEYKMTIRTTFRSDEDYPMPELERHLIYVPETEWTYSHHPSITWFKGKYYVIFSNGRVNEDDVGQRVLISSSENFSEWSKPEPLIGPLPGKHSEKVLTAAGFYQYDGKLIAYYGEYEYKPESLANGKRGPADVHHMNVGLYAVSTQSGDSWSEPVDMDVPIVPNHGPQKLSSGRLLISGNTMFPYTDDPAGLSGWRQTGIYPEEMGGSFADDSETFRKVSEKTGWPVALCEGSFFQTDDNIIHMMLRSGTDRLWVTESADNGETWSEPVETEFTDNVTKFHFGRLPDGLFYYVGSPSPEPRYSRLPLVLSISEDGCTFDRHIILGDEVYPMKKEGMHKGGEYGYPHMYIHDEYLCCVYSRRKEGIEVLRVGLGEF